MRSSRSVIVPPPTVRVVALLGLAVVIAGVSYAIEVTMPAWRELNIEQLAAQVAEENRLFCSDLGFSAGSPQYTRCEAGADLIRGKQIERSQIDTWNLP